MTEGHVKKEVQVQYSQRTADHSRIPYPIVKRKKGEVTGLYAGGIFHWYSFSQGQFNGINE